MNKIIIGKYVNTHGIKGEIRIKSNFKYKERVFQPGNEIIIDKPYIISSYRVHKEYDMVTLKGINSINDILNLKGRLVYIERDNYLKACEYLDDDLIGFAVLCNNSSVGIVSNVISMNNKKIIEVDKKFIPFELIEDINLENKIINIKYLEGLL